MTELDRYVFYWNKGTVYFLHSWAGMRSPGPSRTISEEGNAGWTIGMDGVA